MSSEVATREVVIRAAGLSKRYDIYARPQDRLKHSLMSTIGRYTGREAPQYARHFWALRDVSFEVAKGESVAIVGRNGSGKSTLLQIICGTLSPTAGVIETRGRMAALLELGSGFNPEFTGRENVYMNAALLGLSRREIDESFDDIAAFADIGDFIEQPVKVYSSGMYVRLAFAIIAHVKADILVIDEALAVGDAFFTQKCMRFLRRFMQTHTVLFVSHDTGAVRNLCNRAIWLEGGSLQAEGSPKAITERYLEAFFEAQHGKSTSTRIKPEYAREAGQPLADQRSKIAASPLRNDIEIFRFDHEAAGFGAGDAAIIDVVIRDEEGRPLSFAVGGETVRVAITVEARAASRSLIIGFFVKDRLGQVLFGDNTYLAYCDDPVSVSPGERVVATFEFTMPRLARGDYAISAAVATGTQESHVQQHWIHDALIFRCAADVGVTGIVGLPMRDISMSKAEQVDG